MGGSVRNTFEGGKDEVQEFSSFNIELCLIELLTSGEMPDCMCIWYLGNIQYQEFFSSENS